MMNMSQSHPAVANKTPVRVLARTEDGQWFQVETGDGLQGWILGSYLFFQQ
jgi:uncharacterized protein YgiM (DUF1202 family)